MLAAQAAPLLDELRSRPPAVRSRELLQGLLPWTAHPFARVELQQHGIVEALSGLLGLCEDDSVRASVLALLCQLLLDPECNFEFGLRGGHRMLLRLVAHENDGICDLAGAAVAACIASIPPDAAFPMTALPDFSIMAQRQPVWCCIDASTAEGSIVAPAVLDAATAAHGGVLPAVDSDSDSHGTVAGDAPAAPSWPLAARDRQLLVIARTVPARMTWQGTTGFKLWGAASPLARWLHARREWLAGKAVLEVGAGVGLPGLVAAHHARAVVITDFDDPTLANIGRNVQLNLSAALLLRHGTHEGAAPPAPAAVDAAAPGASPATCAARMCDVAVARLDWGALPSASASDAAPAAGPEDVLAWVREFRVEPCGMTRTPPSIAHEERLRGAFDIVVASDVVFDADSAAGVARSFRHFLRPDGCAVLFTADARSRFGVDRFPHVARENGLRVTARRVRRAAVDHAPEQHLRFLCFECSL